MLFKRDEAFIDDLTGIYNRRFLKEYLAIEIKKYSRYYTPFTLLFLDLDNFKHINDSKGHIEGDKALKEFVRLIKEYLRKSDILVRYGGDEFIVILPHTNRNAGLIVAKRIVERIKKHEYFSTLGTGVSIGVAQYPEDGKNIDELLASADEGLYLAKRHGKGRVFFSRGIGTKPQIPSLRFINRHDETEKLKNALRENTYNLYLVHGDIGIGKTRFIKELLSHYKDNILFTKAFNWGHNFPYYVVRDLLKKLYNTQRSEFLNLYKELPEVSKRHISNLVPGLNAKGEGHTEKEEKEVFLHSIYGFLKGFVKDNPLFLIDDIQWIDNESANFFIYAVKNNPSIKIIATHRIGDKSSGYTLIDESLKEKTFSITIEPLSKEYTEELIKEILRGNVGPEITEFIYKRSGGNPYYIEEIVRSLFEENLLYLENGSKWKLQDTAYDMHVAPKSAESIIKSKLRALNAQHRRILELFAVYGDVISIDKLSHLVSIGEGELYNNLDRIVEAGLLEEESYKTYMFPAGIIRDVILKEISTGKRVYYHRKVLEYFEEFVPKSEREEKSALLAYHYKMIGDKENAAKFYNISAENAKKVFAFHSVLYYLKESYSLVPDEETLFKIANAYYDIGEFNESLSILKELVEKHPNNFRYLLKLADVHEILDNIEESEKIIQYILNNCNEDEIQDQARMQLAWIKSRQRKHKEAIELYHKVIENAKKRHDEKLVAKCYQELGVCYRRMWELEESERYYLKALESSYAKSNRIFYLVIKFSLASVIFNKGYPENAIQILKELKDEFKKMGAVYYYSLSLVNLGACYYAIGELDEAKKVLEVALDYIKGLDNRYLLSYVYANLADIRCEVDDFKGAAEYLEQVVDLNDKSIENLYNMLYLASLYAKMGKLKKTSQILNTYTKLKKDVHDEELELHELRRKIEIGLISNEDIKDLIPKTEASLNNIKNTTERVYLALYIALWYAKKKEIDKAIEYVNMAQKMLPQAKNFNIIEFHEILLDIYIYLGNKNMAFREFNLLKAELIEKKNFKKLEKLERKISEIK